MSLAKRPHPGDCPHHPDERIARDDPFKGRFQDECQSCGLLGALGGNRRDAARRFEVAIVRERRKRRAEYEEERDFAGIESLMKEPPGARVMRGRRV